MKLNKFIWDNYKESTNGKMAISIFKEGDIASIIDNYFPNVKNIYDNPIEIIDVLNCIVSPELPDKLDQDQDAKLYFLKIIEDGVVISFEDGDCREIEPNDFGVIFRTVSLISLWLYTKFPKFYKPYLYIRNYQALVKIADTFEIDLPEVPLKKYKKERCVFYWQLCEVLNNFQKENSLTNEELCAFLYDFSPKYLTQNETVKVEELPLPTQVWMVGGNVSGSDFDFLNNAKNGDEANWQGNIDTRRGDIVVMYCLTPLSSIHSIWRATSDGFPDPFFDFYNLIKISNPIRVPDIHIKELKEDAYFSKNSLVRSNMQGLNGRSLSSVDYEELLKLFKNKNFNIDTLPQLYRPRFITSTDIQNERGVELQILEPLIEKLGYYSNDWTRQLTVRMGRGERNYPDYSFFVTGGKGYEKAKMIIEAKFMIKNNKELEDTFKQAHSYALRLDSSKIVLCDKDAIWIYQKNSTGFDRSKYYKKFWQELENSDEFNKLKILIGNN